MNRFGGCGLPDRETPSASKRLFGRDEIEAHTAAFLAKGGTVEAGVSKQLRAEIVSGTRDTTCRRYVGEPPPRDKASATYAAKRRQRARQAIVLPGSGDGPKSKALRK